MRARAGVFGIFIFGAVCFGAPVIVVEPNSLNFTELEGGSNPSAKVFYISDLGTGKLDWEIIEDCSWLSVDPTNGEALPGETDEVTVSVDITGLSAGEYSFELMITDPDASNSPQVITINLNLIGPILEVSPLEFELFALEGGINPESKVLTIGNGGGGVLNWEIETSSSCDWLSIGSLNGNLGLGEDEEVVLDFDTTGLSVGEYNCGLTIIDADGLNISQEVMVKLYIIYYDGILNVPSEFFTIQDAIDAATDGHEIIVADGTYTGEGNRNIDFKCKALTVRSQNGPENCIIDCEENGRGFIFQSGEDTSSVLDGFTIINGVSAGGSGIYCSNSNPMVKNCTFNGNLANSWGGGMSIRGCSPKVVNCTFSSNNTLISGGGIYCSYSSPTLINCIFSGNNGYYGGGMYNGGNSNPMLINCTFINNEAWREGGGMYNDYGNPVVTNCTFSNNDADAGGGMYNWKSNSTVINCIFSRNNGGIFNDYETDLTVINCTVCSNNGGIFNTYLSNLIVTNSIFWENYEDIIDDGSGTQIITYSNFPYGYDGIGNMNENPLFVDAQNGDYHLLMSSPCVNSGDPTFTVEPNETDIDGEPRVMGGRVDMGADEVGEKQGDFTRDGVINIDDFGVLGNSWGTGPGDEKWYVLCDLWEDGIIDITDLAAFVEDWMWEADWYQQN